MRNRQPRVLYFTKNALPTDKEKAHAATLSGNIGFRFAAGAKDGVGFEDNIVATAGVNVPAMYREKGIPYVKTNAELRRHMAESAPAEEFDPDSVEGLGEQPADSEAPVDGAPKGNNEQNSQPPADGSWGNGGTNQNT